MKISHEVPRILMEESRKFNDYDYALVHKYSQDLEYKQFFIDSIKLGRTVILDNSLFETENIFNANLFAQAIQETLPTEYIVPDDLENLQETIDSFESWLKGYNTLPGIKIGVVQGKNLDELVTCYKYMANNANKIAISFDYSWYTKLFPNELTKQHSWMKGRQYFIDYLIKTNIINYNKPHHLLGCSLPQEFTKYKHKDYSFIDTIDTSNPVVHAIKGIPYSSTGLEFKESMKLIDLFDTTSINKNILYHNINIFREFCV